MDLWCGRNLNVIEKNARRYTNNGELMYPSIMYLVGF